MAMPITTYKTTPFTISHASCMITGNLFRNGVLFRSHVPLSSPDWTSSPRIHGDR